MKIHVFDIQPETPRTFSFKGAEPFLQEILKNLTEGDPAPVGLPLAPEIHAELELSREKKQVTVTGEAHARISPPCARCLVAVTTMIDAPIDLVLLPHPTDDAPDEGSDLLGMDDIEEYTYRNDEIDLAALLNEQLVLEKPFKILCSEDCLGLCSTCGTNLNESSCQCPAQPKSLAFAGLADLKPTLKD